MDEWTTEAAAPEMEPSGSEWTDFDYRALDMDGRLGAINALVVELTDKAEKLTAARAKISELEVAHGNMQWEVDGWDSESSDDESPAPATALTAGAAAEACGMAVGPGKRLRMMDELPLALVLDPDDSALFPAHVGKVRARGEQRSLIDLLQQTDNVSTLQVRCVFTFFTSSCLC